MRAIAIALACVVASCSSRCGGAGEAPRDSGSLATSYVTGGEEVPLPPNAIAVPLVRQKVGYSCGDVAVLALLRYWDPAHHGATPEQALYAPLRTTEQDGTDPDPMAAYLDATPELRAELSRRASAGDLAASIDRGEPAIVDLQAWQPHARLADFTPWDRDWEDGHYAVLVGYDDRAWFFMDPSTEDRYAYVPRAELEARWHDVLRTGEKIDHWAIFARADGDAGSRPRARAQGLATPMN